MRHLIRARRAGALTIAATAGALAIAGPAVADVTVSPPSVPQTSGANLDFRVTNTEKSTMIRVKLSVPADTPIAEVYPLSVPDWAPDITERKLATPLDTIHGGTPVTEVTQDITWIAMPGKGIAPGASADLSVSLGPLPTLSQMHFDVTPAYADGHAGPPIPPVVLKLTPATPGQAAGGHAAHSGAGTEQAASDPDAALFARTVAAGERGTSIWSIGGWVVAGLLGLGLIWAVLRQRHRDDPAQPDETDGSDEPDADDNDEAGADRGDEPGGAQDGTGKKPVGAGARKASNWRYQDGPG